MVGVCRQVKSKHNIKLLVYDFKVRKGRKKKTFDDFKICEKKVILESHRSNSCRWISSDLMRCNTSGRGLTSQTEGRGTLSSLCLRGKKEERE